MLSRIGAERAHRPARTLDCAQEHDGNPAAGYGIVEGGPRVERGRPFPTWTWVNLDAGAVPDRQAVDQQQGHRSEQ